MVQFVECPTCGNLIEAGNNDCDQCGHVLTAEEQARTANSANASFREDARQATGHTKDELRTIYRNKPRGRGSNRNLMLTALTLIVVFLLVYSAVRNPSHSWPMYAFLIMIAPFGVTGYYIGRRTGNGLEGFWFSALLGPLGLIIAFVLDDKTREPCDECGELVKYEAMVCPHCKSPHQRANW